MLRKEKGFTLIELMIVVAIIGILAAVAIPKFADLIDKAKEASTKGKLGGLRSAVSVYYGSYEGLAPGGVATSGAGADDDLKTALVDDGDSISALPAAEVPTGNHTIAKNTAYDDAMYGQDDYPTSGWAYDSSEIEVWIQCTHTDLVGSTVHNSW